MILDMQVLENPVLYHLTRSWNIPFHIRDRLDHYYLLHWRTEYFFSHPQISMIDHQGIEYSVAYYNQLPPTLRNYTELLLSFRKSALESKGIVLVRGKFGTERKVIV